MCQLLGMNCNVPTDIAFSFEGFRMRGGLTDRHTDGFGIGFFEGKGLRLFLDDKPCAHSPVADLVNSYRIKSTNVVAHIRKAPRATPRWKTPTPSSASCGASIGCLPTTAT